MAGVWSGRQYALGDAEAVGLQGQHRLEKERLGLMDPAVERVALVGP